MIERALERRDRRHERIRAGRDRRPIDCRGRAGAAAAKPSGCGDRTADAAAGDRPDDDRASAQPRHRRRCAAWSPTRSRHATPASLPGSCAPLESLRQAHPDDLSVAICAALEALASNDAGASQAHSNSSLSSSKRRRWIRLPTVPRANARERAQAAGRSRSGWSPARVAGRRIPSVQAYGDRFAARALEAARRQDDRVWLLAMLREQGQLAFDQSDRADAAAVWSRMLDLVVTPPEAKSAPAGSRQAGAAPGDRRRDRCRAAPAGRREPKPPRPKGALTDADREQRRERHFV